MSPMLSCGGPDGEAAWRRRRDDYVANITPPDSAILTEIRQRTGALPFVAALQGDPLVGRLLQLLIRLLRARRVIEIGVFTGSTTLAMAEALGQDGFIVAVENDDRWLSIGAEYWRRAGYLHRIDVRLGDATRVLGQLIDEGRSGTFDLAFVDANKDGYLGYFEQCYSLLRDGGVMVFDNVAFPAEAGLTDSATDVTSESRMPRALAEVRHRYVEGLRRFNQHIARDDRVDLVILPIVDGVTIARKREPSAKGLPW